VYADYERQAREKAPVAWTNVPINRHPIDSVRVQLSRFRAPGDSTDVVTFADVGLRRLARGFEGRARVDVAYTLLDVAGRTLVRDSSRQLVDPASADAAERRAWRKRVRATGEVIYRVEALQPDSMRAARALGEANLAAGSGFGVSDVLLAERVEPGVGPADRWSGFVIAPSVGTFQRRQPIGLLWETYGLAAGDAGSKYRVSVTLERVEAKGVRRVAMKILGGVRDAVGGGDQGEGKTTITYEREVPARPAVVDYLTLDPGTIPAGTYRLTVQVTDLVAGGTATTVREVRVVEQD
jgi:hypothetical protein